MDGQEHRDVRREGTGDTELGANTKLTRREVLKLSLGAGALVALTGGTAVSISSAARAETRAPVLASEQANTTPASTVTGRASFASQDLFLRLEGALLQRQNAPRDITLELTSSHGKWDKDIWGYAPTYNVAEHTGSLLHFHHGSRGTQVFNIRMDIGSDPWIPGGTALYTTTITADGTKVSGSYQGTFNRNAVSGAVTGELLPRLLPPEGFVPVTQGDHSRLLFRKSEFAAIKSRLDTPTGRRMLAYLESEVEQTGGDEVVQAKRALGLGLLWQLSGDKGHAKNAMNLVEKHTHNAFGPTAHGGAQKCLYIAYAYDLIYDYADNTFRNEINDRLRRLAYSLYEGSSRADFNPSDPSNWLGSYRSVYGVWALVLLGEKSDYLPEPPRPAVARMQASTDFVRGQGVPVVPLQMDQMPREWIWCGPWHREHQEDVLASIGGVADAHPEVGTAVTYRGTTHTFETLDSSCIWNSNTWTDGKGAIDLTCPTQHELYTTSYFYTVIKNDQARWLQLYTGASTTGVSNSTLYLAGQRLNDRDYVYLEPGLYPMMLESYLGYTDPWGKIAVRPHFEVVTEEQVKSGHNAQMADYRYYHSMWREGYREWRENGHQDPAAPVMLRKAERQVRRYVETALGDHGWPTEGPAYTGTTLNLVYPFAHALGKVKGIGITGKDNLRWVLPMFTARTLFPSLELPPFSPAGEAIAEREGLFAKGFEFVPDQLKPAVLWYWDQLGGFNGTNPNDFGGLDVVAFALVNYPFGMKERTPAKGMSKDFRDLQKGGYVFRTGWGETRDQMAQVWLKSQPLRDVWQAPDAGAFRIYGFDTAFADRTRDWPKGGDRSKENVVQLPDDPINFHGGSTTGLGAVTTYYAVRPNGSGVVSMNMDRMLTGLRPGKAAVDYDESVLWENLIDLGIRGMRAFAADFGGSSGAPALYAIVDKITGGGRKIWQMHTNGTVAINGNAFTITGNIGATLKATFLAPSNVSLTTEADQSCCGYEGGSYVQAMGGHNYFVVMTLQQGEVPEVKVSGSGLSATANIGSQRVSFDGEKLEMASF